MGVAKAQAALRSVRLCRPEPCCCGRLRAAGLLPVLPAARWSAGRRELAAGRLAGRLLLQLQNCPRKTAAGGRAPPVRRSMRGRASAVRSGVLLLFYVTPPAQRVGHRDTLGSLGITTSLWP